MKVKDIFDFLNNLFPVSTANDYDNPGLLIGNPENKVSKALIALDCTIETVEEAEKNNCQLIITHHPVIFSPLKNILAGSISYELIKRDIAVISMHTNLDVCENGVNDCLAKTIGLSDITPYLTEKGYLLKCGIISSTNAESFATSLKKALGGCVKYVDGGKKINSVLVCSGSGGDFIEEAINGEFDALVTADIKHHQFLTARDNGVSLFDAGHYNTEDIIVEDLKQMLSNQFKEYHFLTYHPETIKFA